LNPSDAFNAVAKAIAREFGVPVASITAETVAGDVAGWDSFSHGMLLMAIESEIGALLPLERVMDAANVGDLAAIVAEAAQ